MTAPVAALRALVAEGIHTWDCASRGARTAGAFVIAPEGPCNCGLALAPSLLRRLDLAEAVVQLVERDHDHFHSMPWEKCQSRTCEAARHYRAEGAG